MYFRRVSIGLLLVVSIASLHTQNTTAKGVVTDKYGSDEHGGAINILPNILEQGRNIVLSLKVPLEVSL